MPAQQWDRGGTVRGDRNHRRLVALVGEIGRQGADQDTAGANADDGCAGGKQAGEVAPGIVEGNVRICDTARQAMHASTGQLGCQPVRQCGAVGG